MKRDRGELALERAETRKDGQSLQGAQDELLMTSALCAPASTPRSSTASVGWSPGCRRPGALYKRTSQNL